jgi:hypothetical protein
MLPARLVDGILLFAGLIMLVWATILSTRPESAETPSLIAMRTQHLTEGRSFSAERNSSKAAREWLADTPGGLARQ